MRKGRKLNRSREHARIETITMLGASCRMGPVGLQFYAADFLQAVKFTARTDVPFSPARYYLVCHAIELALKAFLCLKGRSMLELAEVHGHHLAPLLDDAERNGLCDLIPLSERKRDQIRAADAYYAEKVFEYPAVGEMVRGMSKTPDIGQLLGAAGAMITALRRPCLEA